MIILCSAVSKRSASDSSSSDSSGSSSEDSDEENKVKRAPVVVEKKIESQPTTAVNHKEPPKVTAPGTTHYVCLSLY